MVRKWVIAAFIFQMLAAGAAAESLITGTVVVADPHSGSFVLKRGDTQALITVVATPGRMPRNMTPGTVVKVWGEFAPRQAETFFARKIKSVGAPDKRDDPTGVRKRLNRLLKGKGFF